MRARGVRGCRGMKMRRRRVRADTEQPRVSRLQVLVLCRRSEDERDLAPRRRRRGVPRRKRGRTGRGHGAGVPSLSCPCPLPHSSQQSQSVSAAVASRIGIAGVPGGNLAGSGSWARHRRKQAGGQWQMRRQVVEPSVHTHVTGRITGLGLRRHEYPASSTLARGDFRNK